MLEQSFKEYIKSYELFFFSYEQAWWWFENDIEQTIDSWQLIHIIYILYTRHID